MRLWFHLNWLHGEHAVAGRGGKSGEENQKPASAGRSGEGGKTERRAGKVQLSEHLSDPDVLARRPEARRRSLRRNQRDDVVLYCRTLADLLATRIPPAAMPSATAGSAKPPIVC